ncbi:MAG: transposase [Deltaproteobacteria bacterium]|nr:transposase [Deltaproteobacteria bacterium]
MQDPNTTFEITIRAIQGRLLLRPSKELNELILGVLGRALERHSGILLHLFVVASNHMHLIITAPNVQLLSSFMAYLNSSLAREAGRLHHWREKFWGRRYTSIAILDFDCHSRRQGFPQAGCLHSVPRL